MDGKKKKKNETKMLPFKIQRKEGKKKMTEKKNGEKENEEKEIGEKMQMLSLKKLQKNSKNTNEL